MAFEDIVAHPRRELDALAATLGLADKARPARRLRCRPSCRPTGACAFLGIDVITLETPSKEAHRAYQTANSPDTGVLAAPCNRSEQPRSAGRARAGPGGRQALELGSSLMASAAAPHALRSV